MKPQPWAWAHLQIVPDCLLDNGGADTLAGALAEMYRPPLARFQWNKDPIFLPCPPVARAAWEIVLSPERVSFHLAVPAEWRAFTAQKTAVAWPQATVRECPDPLAAFRGGRLDAGECHLRNHYFLAIKVDRRSLAPLPSLLETVRSMTGDDLAAVSLVMVPEAPDWYQSAVAAYERFRSGKMPRRLSLSPADAAVGAARVGAAAGLDAAAFAASFISGEEIEAEPLEDADRAKVLREGPLSPATLSKAKFPAFDVTLRLMAQSSDPARRQAILRGLATSFRELADDNELVPRLPR